MAFWGVLVCYVDTITQKRVKGIKLESYFGEKLGRILAVEEEILTLGNAKCGANESFF